MQVVYLDTCMVIGLIEGDKEQRIALKQYLSDKVVFSSELVRLEARLLAVREKNSPQLKLYSTRPSFRLSIGYFLLIVALPTWM